MNDLISRQAAIDALHMHLMYRLGTDSNKKRLDDWINSLPSAQPEYKPVTAEDFAKTMSENTIYNFVTWHSEALTLMNKMGFVICKKTM